MKKVIKTMLAFAALMLCGEAWADRVISFNICQPGTGANVAGEISGETAQSTIVGDIPTSGWTQAPSTAWQNTGITMANVYDTETQQTTSKQTLLSWNASGANNYGRPSSGSATADHQYMWCWLGKKDNTDSASTFVIDQVPFACYDVYLYFSGKDTAANAALTVNGKTYSVSQDGTPIVGNESWGNASSSSAALGANVVKFSGMTGKFSFARATNGYGLAAVQIVEVPSTTAFVATPATDTALLDSNYLDTGFAIESIDVLLDYNFSGIMSGSYVGGTIAPTAQHYRPANAYNARKVGDSVYVEYQTYDNQTKVVLVEFKLITAQGADRATVHAKAVGVAYTTSNALGVPYMAVDTSDTITFINGSLNTSGGSTIPLATTNNGAGYGVRSILATPIKKSALAIKNTDQVTGAEGVGGWNLNTFTISAGASGYPAGSLLKIKSISLSANASPSNKIRLNGVESAAVTTPGGTANWESTQGYEAKYTFSEGVVVVVGESYTIESIDANGSEVTTRLRSRPSFTSDDYKIITYRSQPHYALCVIDAESVGYAPRNIAVLNNATSDWTDASTWTSDVPVSNARVSLVNSGDSVITVDSAAQVSQLAISGSGTLTIKGAQNLKFASFSATGLTGLTLEYDCTSASYVADWQLKNFIKGANGSCKVVFKGAGSKGATIDFGSPYLNTTIGSHMVFDGGTHTLRVDSESQGLKFAQNGSVENPTILVTGCATLNFNNRNLCGWQSGASTTAGLIRVNDGSTIEFNKSTGTMYWAQQIYLEPGATMGFSNNAFNINGGATTSQASQIYVPASTSANGKVAKVIQRSANNYLVVNNQTASFPGCSFFVGENSVLEVDAQINGSNASTPFKKHGTGQIVFKRTVNALTSIDSGYVGTSSATFTNGLTIGSGASVVFPAGHAANDPYTLCTGTLTVNGATEGVVENAAFYVGDVRCTGTLTYNTTNKTVSYAITNAEITIAGHEVKLSELNALGVTGALTINIPADSYLDINADTITASSITINNAGKLTVVKTTSTGWGTISELPSGITVSDSSQVVYDDGSVKATYFGQQPSYWSNVYAGPTTSYEVGDASASGQWWKRNNTSQIPLYTNGNYQPTLFDGNLIPLVQVGADGYKTINAPLSSNNGWEGWQLRVGAVNGVKINVAKLVKIQDNADVGMLIGVDETSKVIIENYANGNNEREITFDIAAPEGLVFNNNLNASANGRYAYKFHDKGSVLINGAYNIGSSHKIKEMKLVIGNGRYKSIVERKLIGWTSSTLSDSAFTLATDAMITTSDDQIAATLCGNAALTLLDDLGTYLLVKKSDGLYVQYIGYSDETPSEYMWKFNKASGNWGDANAWTGVLDTTGATHSWSELAGSTTPVTVFLDANVTSAITIDGTINAKKVILTNTSADPKSFAFNTTYEGEGGSQTVPENVKLNAPVDTTAFNGELGLRGVITGEITMGPDTQIVFVAPTEGQQTTAYDYTITSRANPIEVRGPGTFRVPSSMYTVPFKVMPTKTEEGYTGNAGYILFDIPTSETVTVSDGIAGDGGVKKSGAGTLVITPASTYTGKTLVDAGKIKAGNNNSFGTTGDIEVASGATLDINGKYLPNQIYLSGDGVDGAGALVNGTNIGSDHPWKITLRANASWGGSGFTHFGSRSVVDLGGFTFTKKGSNNFPLNNTSGITNGKIVVEAGEFQNNNNANDLSTVDLEIKSGATLNMNGGTSLTVKSFKCEGSITGTNVKLVIAQNGYLYESSASIPKLELLEGATVVAAANKKITIGTSLTATAVKVNASAKTEESDVTLFTMPSEADAIALAAKISLVDDTEHIVVAKGADVCLAPAAISDEDAFETAVATAGDVILGGNLTLTKTIQVADGVTIILGENTISGGTLNLASGTISFHVEQGKSTTISSTITGAAKIRKTGGGELTMSANNSAFTGSWEVVGGDLKGSQKLAYGHDVNGDGALTFKVDAGATLYVDKMDDISYNLVMAGGTVKNGSGNNIDLNHRQIRKMTLEADSRVEGANFGFVPGGHSNGKITLDGHTLTVAMASGNKFAFDGMTDDDVGGVIKVVSGKIGNASVQNEAVLSHTQIVLEGGAFECERQMTVKSVKVVSAGENSGTLKVKECVEGALSMPTLTLDDNATIKLADSQSITVSSTLTLGANLKVNLTGITTAVGGEMTVLTAPSSFSFGSKTLTCVNNEGAADNTWILKANGNTLKAYRNAEVGGVCPSPSNNLQTFMVSSSAMTIEDFAKNYTLAANFTGGNISATDKAGTMIDARIENGIFKAQFQILNNEMKWRNIEVKIVSEDSLYKAQVKYGTTGYEDTDAADKFGKTGTTVRGGYALATFTATPNAMTENFAFDGTIENGVVKSPTGWLTSFSYAYSASNTAIGPEPNTVVCKTTSNGPYGDIAFGSKSNFTVSFYSNALDVNSASQQAMLLCLGSGSKGVYLKKTTEGKIAMDLYNASSADYASDDVEDGKGFHLYTITKGSGKVYNLYIDGKKIAAQYKDYAPASGFQIAAPYGNNSNFAVGLNLTVAGLFGYDRVLSDYQIAELAKLYPAVPMAKADGIDTPIRGIDASELVKKYNELKPGSAEDATSINSNGVNGLPLWKSDILGLDPTDENSTTVVISGAQTTDTGSMKLLTGIKPNPEIVRVTLKSGATAACDDTDVTPMADDGSFTVTLPTGGDKVKYYKLTYEFPSAE